MASSSPLDKSYLSRDYVGTTYLGLIPQDVFKVADNIVFIYELVRKARLEHIRIPKELVSSLRFWISEITLKLSPRIYVNIDELRRLIRRKLINGDIHEVELKEFLNKLLGLWTKKNLGGHSCTDIEELINCLASLIGSKVTPNNVLGKVIKDCNPDLAIQVSLNLLILSVGGVCYDDVLED